MTTQKSDASFDSAQQLEEDGRPRKGKRGTWLKRILLGLAVLLVVLVGVGAWYVSDYYHADATALEAMADADGTSDGVAVREMPGGSVAFVPCAESGEALPAEGFIFYSGGKVQPESYAPLLTELARHGVLCVMVRPLFNLAILSVNAADGVREAFPQVNSWSISGHSLGGVAACLYATNHANEFRSIVLLAAFPMSDISGYGGEVLELRGTNDGLVTEERFSEAREKFPSTLKDPLIEGGNHAYFGNYGEQAGDGVATISREEQQARAVSAIVDLLQPSK